MAMLLYIWWRFESNFALGAIATLILDTTKYVSFFALVGFDFNLTAIATLLTIIGYSVNDKVVVYDRIARPCGSSRNAAAPDHRHEHQPGVRAVYLHLVAILLSILPMSIWGGGAVESFAIPIVFGVFIATSSSIFIAAPILLLLGDW